MSALFLLNLFRLFGITEMFCWFVGRKQITVRVLAMWRNNSTTADTKNQS